jgi:hypothetical protein
MLDLPIMGTNAPREHQRVIRKLISGLDKLYVLGAIQYEPFPETMLDEGKTSPTPDVILYDSVSDTDVVLIEVSTTKGFNGDFKKVAELTEYYNLKEGFVYNYKTNAWKKYKQGIGQVTENPSFCDTIGFDLNDFLK